MISAAPNPCRRADIGSHHFQDQLRLLRLVPRSEAEPMFLMFF